ncbi:hypothetical protein [Nocardioides marmoraquaticus]
MSHRTLHPAQRASLPPALAAYFAGQPIQPIGYLPSGRAIFPIAGGAPDPDDGKDGKADKDKKDQFEPITSQEELDRRIGPRLAREREKYSDYDDLKAKAEQFDKHVEESRTEQEKAVEAARKEGETTATQASHTRLVAAEARALAAEQKFRSPASAVRLLDLSTVMVGDDGEPDRDAIKAQLDKLAETEPWQVDTGTDGKDRRPRPDPTQGKNRDRSDKAGSSIADLMRERREARAAKD